MENLRANVVRALSPGRWLGGVLHSRHRLRNTLALAIPMVILLVIGGRYLYLLSVERKLERELSLLRQQREEDIHALLSKRREVLREKSEKNEAKTQKVREIAERRRVELKAAIDFSEAERTRVADIEYCINYARRFLPDSWEAYSSATQDVVHATADLKLLRSELQRRSENPEDDIAYMVTLRRRNNALRRLRKAKLQIEKAYFERVGR